MDSQLLNLQRKAKQYREVLQNTANYRKDWQEELKEKIMTQLGGLKEALELDATVECKSEMENLEAVVFSPSGRLVASVGSTDASSRNAIR